MDIYRSGWMQLNLSMNYHHWIKEQEARAHNNKDDIPEEFL